MSSGSSDSVSMHSLTFIYFVVCMFIIDQDLCKNVSGKLATICFSA